MQGDSHLSMRSVPILYAPASANAPSAKPSLKTFGPLPTNPGELVRLESDAWMMPWLQMTVAIRVMPRTPPFTSSLRFLTDAYNVGYRGSGRVDTRRGLTGLGLEILVEQVCP